MEIRDVRLKLEREILQKLDSIREKVLTSTSVNEMRDAQLLLLVNDELEEVLMNWQLSGPLSAVPFDDLDDLDL
jgi:hypothetical protein